MSHVKKICLCAVCVALCCVLPTAFHSLGLGVAFSPMHLPVLLCGLLCGWPYGLLCGVVGPLLSCLITSMPAASQLVYMIPELAAYGFFSGLLYRFIRTGSFFADVYLALIPAMILGRVVGGIVRAIFYLAGAQEYSIALWAGAYLGGTLPGAIVQLVVLPLLVLALTKARLVPARYPSSDRE